MQRVNKKNEYEVTNVEHGKTWIMTGVEVLNTFGREEATEALNGYSPNLVIVEMN